LNNPKKNLSIYTILAQSLKLTSRKTRQLVALSAIAMSSLRVLDVIGLGLILPIVGLLGSSEISVEKFTGPYIASFFTGFSNSEITLVLAAVLVGLIAIKSILSVASTYWFGRFFFNDQALFTARMFQAYLMAPIGFHDKKNAAELLRNISNAIPGWYGITIRQFSGLIADVFLAVAILGVILYANLLAALMGISVLILGAAMFWFGAAKPVRTIAKEGYDLRRNLNQTLLESLSAVKDIKVLNREGFFSKAFIKYSMRLSRTNYLYQVYQQIPQHLLEFIVAVSISGFIVIAHYHDNQQDTLAFIALFGASMLRLMPVAQRMVGILNQIRSIEPALNDILLDIKTFGDWIYTAKNIPNLTTSNSSDKTVQNVVDFKHYIKLNNINFGYEANKLILKNIMTTIEKGASLGIVGPSGAGKSTFAELLLGLITPHSGEIQFDGIIRPFEEPTIIRSIGYVPQEVVLLDDSVRKNIAFGIGDHEINETRLLNAVQKSQLTDFLENLTDGLNSIVGERGVRLSGGQKQRIAIARALYLDPHILILDEATSSLDVETELRITETLKSLAKEKTLIIIAHRLSTVQHCDKLIFLNHGEIIAEGTFSELQSKCVEFQNWVNQAQLNTEHNNDLL
jgi:ATP-binding cassette, subfamily B, bacterial PglK